MMNAAKTIKKYVGPSGGLKFLAWLLAIATVALLGVGIQQSTIKDDPADAVWFDPVNAQPGDYVYLDVVGVSNWLYKIESDSSSTVYYSVEDADDYLYTVILYDAQYDSMLTQQVYWNREGENDPNAAVYRIYGTARATSTEVKEALTDSWSTQGLTSVSDYEYYFGTMHLDATSLPSDGRGMGYVALGILSLVLWIASAASISKSRKAMKQSVKRLEQQGELEAAAAELAGSVKIVGKDKCRISDNYVFTKKGGVALSIKDILWAYRHLTKTNGINSNTQLMAYACNGKAYSLLSVGGGDKKSLTTEIITAIAERNPTILLGYTDANRAEYRARLKEFKASGKRPSDMVAAAAAEAAAVEAPVEAAPVETAPVEAAPVEATVIETAAETAPVEEAAVETAAEAAPVEEAAVEAAVEAAPAEEIKVEE